MGTMGGAEIVFLLLASGFFIDAAVIREHEKNEEGLTPARCNSTIYCNPILLKTVQLAEVFNDSKTFVDMSQNNDPAITLANFNRLMNTTDGQPTRAQIVRFVDENFSVKYELENYTLPDWTKNPPILKSIGDPTYRTWAKDLNRIWKKLARAIRKDVAVNPDRHSIIYVPNAFIIPGGRFSEFYYWDSYWVIKGILLCGMTQTARGMIDNFISIIERYGFIPNGGRVYYLMRSQPPLLIPMVKMYIDVTQDYDYLATIVDKLEQEFSFWQKYRMVDVQMNGITYKMARYVVRNYGPRPESFREDYIMAMKLPEEAREKFYNNIKAAAESGWDFSARWFLSYRTEREPSLLHIDTDNIIPVELNSFLQQNAALLSYFFHLLKNNQKSIYYAGIAEYHQVAIEKVLWNKEEGIWNDYNVRQMEHSTNFYPTNLAPLYTGSYAPMKVKEYASRAVEYIKKTGIDAYYGGTPASLNHTGEQWDFPNAWPPLQSIMIQGLYRTGVPIAMELATDLASRWLTANCLGFQATGKMFEKYDATFPGHQGGGGEYTVQEGFGWSNGVILEFLNTFKNLKATDGCALTADDDDVMDDFYADQSDTSRSNNIY